MIGMVAVGSLTEIGGDITLLWIVSIPVTEPPETMRLENLTALCRQDWVVAGWRNSQKSGYLLRKCMTLL
jgi:hypothetical protein